VRFNSRAFRFHVNEKYAAFIPAAVDCGLQTKKDAGARLEKRRARFASSALVVVVIVVMVMVVVVMVMMHNHHYLRFCRFRETSHG
jgi:hypothetical protein